jgi:hypothetical protein
MVNIGNFMLSETLVKQIKMQTIDGLANSYCLKTNVFCKPYPEVTGYILHLFSILNIERPLLQQMVDKVCKYQNSSGAFRTFYDVRGYLFDTSIILRGLIAADRVGIKVPKASIENAYDYILNASRSKFWYADQVTVKDYYFRLMGNDSWSWGRTPINLKISEAIKDYDSTYSEYRTPIGFYDDLYSNLNTKIIRHTHPSGYQLEGLLSLGKTSDARFIFDSYFKDNFESGYLAYAPGLDYEYTSGTIQLGIVAYKLGYLDISEEVYNRFACVLSIYGLLPQYLNLNYELNGPHSECNVWGAKYLIELEKMLKEGGR